MIRYSELKVTTYGLRYNLFSRSSSTDYYNNIVKILTNGPSSSTYYCSTWSSTLHKDWDENQVNYLTAYIQATKIKLKQTTWKEVVTHKNHDSATSVLLY